MSLTFGRAPFARPPAGHFNIPVEAPGPVLYLEDSPRRIRTVFNGETVADSTRMKLLHETGRMPVYYFPEEDVRRDLLRATGHREERPAGTEEHWSVAVGDRLAEGAAWTFPTPRQAAAFVAGHWAFRWDAMDAWYEEDEEVFVHARDPYHRVDVLRSSRHVRVFVEGALVADTRRPRLLFETGLRTRYYIPPEDVETTVLEESGRQTRCPYKGTASYHSVRTPGRLVRDIVWYYPEPLPEAGTIAGLLAFYDERVELEVDGVRQ